MPGTGRSKARWSIWLEGIGAGILVMLPLLWMHLTPSRETLYHELLPMNPVYQGLLIDFVFVAAVCIILLLVFDRVDSRCRTLWWLLVTAGLAVRVQSTLVVAMVVSPRLVTPARVFLPIALLGLLVWFIRRSWYSATMRGARAILLMLGFSVFWIAPELAYMAFHPEPRDSAGFAKPVAAPAHQRILWILFDEASYDQLFDHRQPGMSFPNFDRFAAQSALFTDVQPSGKYTEMIIPSLLTGHVITHERSDLDGQLLVRTQDNPALHLYRDQRSLFADAQALGWSTGAIGWYNPYCRVFESELDDCYWALTSELPGRYSPRRPALINAVAPLGKRVLRALGQPLLYGSDAQMHADDYQALTGRSLREISENRVGFLFVHLPLPHPGGFYNRKTEQIGVPGSYLDNLALTDKTLGELLDAVAQSPLGPETTIIVSSDHSWRTWLWRSTAQWMPEDTAASQNRFDSRPLLMVHFAGQTGAAKIPEAIPLIRMHAMIGAMLAGKIQSEAQLEAWAAKQ